MEEKHNNTKTSGMSLEQLFMEHEPISTKTEQAEAKVDTKDSNQSVEANPTNQPANEAIGLLKELDPELDGIIDREIQKLLSNPEILKEKFQEFAETDIKRKPKELFEKILKSSLRSTVKESISKATEAEAKLESMKSLEAYKALKDKYPEVPVDILQNVVDQFGTLISRPKEFFESILNDTSESAKGIVSAAQSMFKNNDNTIKPIDLSINEVLKQEGNSRESIIEMLGLDASASDSELSSALNDFNNVFNHLRYGAGGIENYRKEQLKKEERNSLIAEIRNEFSKEIEDLKSKISAKQTDHIHVKEPAHEEIAKINLNKDEEYALSYIQDELDDAGIDLNTVGVKLIESNSELTQALNRGKDLDMKQIRKLTKKLISEYEANKNKKVLTIPDSNTNIETKKMRLEDAFLS